MPEQAKHTCTPGPYTQVARMLDEAITERDRLKVVNAELVAALESLLGIEWNRSQRRKYSLRREKARAAIAKATGSQSND